MRRRPPAIRARSDRKRRMSETRYAVRSATLRDASAIAEVHDQSYRSTYAGIFPQSVFDGVSLPSREQLWTRVLTDQAAASRTLVGCTEEGSVVGFISGGRERTGLLNCDAEVYAIYLLPSVQRRGLGTLLIREFARELRDQGFQSMAVWVLKLNMSKAFYETLGGQILAEQTIERGGQSFLEVAYGWAKLDDLAKP
jgi:ribosomal protein S18 acetylase RimI-like enzyme